MKIAYFTNQYPHVRHTFIRREIAGLEALGVAIEKFSIRDTSKEIVDAADLAEYGKTQVILNAGKFRLLSELFKHALGRPGRMMKALGICWRFGKRSDRGRLRQFIYLAEACLLRRWLAEKQITHLHVHFATNPTTVAYLCQVLGGPAYSITVHGPEEWDQPEALCLREKYTQAKFVVCVTDFGRCQAYRWTPIEVWPKIHVVRCGIDAGFLEAPPTPVPETNRLLLVAGMVPQKGHLLLLEALALVKAKGIAFEMALVGDGPLRSILETRAQALGIAAHVKFLGWQTNQQVREHLSQARALIMPSFAENLPVAMMEALAMGRPVLGTYIAGVPELIDPGQNGWLVPAGNAELTAQAIVSILQSPRDALTAMGSHGREKVARCHNAANEAGKMKVLFEQESLK